MMVLEVLGISIANYFTSAPELIRPTHLQLSQVKNLINYIQQNYLNIVELVVTRLPPEALNNTLGTSLLKTLAQKKHKRGKKTDSPALSIRQFNENLANILKNLTRQGSTQ
jgi:hypothetical protein